MRRCHVRQLILAAVLPATLAFWGGCADIVIAPPPEAVLAGTWELTTDQSTGLTQTLLTFDANGRLTKITYKVGASATINVNNAVATTRVDGNEVSIVSSPGLNSLIINGTLNESKTVIEGKQGTEVRLGGITISIDRGAVRLIKQ